MSFFGMGPMGAMSVDPAKLELAEVELDVLKVLHESIIEGCRQKCLVPYYTESDLSKGESSCVDRCSSKFFQANNIIGNYLRDKRITAEQYTSPSYVLPTLGQHGTFE